MKPYAGLTVLGVTVALSSSLYLAQSPRPFDLVGVKFCPQTANINTPEHTESQQRLDRQYCQYEHKMLKETWEKQQFESSKPLPDGSFTIRNIPAVDSGVVWLLVAPVASGIAYLSWSKKSEDDEMSAHLQLEAFKTTIKLTTVSNQGKREFKTLQTNRAWDKQKVKHGFISVEAMQDKLNRQTEIQDKTHTAALSEYDAMIAELKKKRSESLRDAAKADKEREKVLGKAAADNTHTESPDSKLKNDLIEALKSYEDGWLWKIIDNQKPVWVLGEAGSGKSTLAASIVMIRQYLFDMPLYQLVDAHAGDNLRKAWKYLSPVSVAQDEEQIGQAFDDARERWLDRINNQPDKRPQQLLVDEFTNYSDSDITKEPAKKFVKASLSDPRKADEWLVCIAHFFTNTATGGSDGTAKGRARGTIQIDRKTANGKTPLNNATINGLNNEEGEPIEDLKVTIPSWLNPEDIHNHFNGKPINFE
jgi:hypothetical protein